MGGTDQAKEHDKPRREPLAQAVQEGFLKEGIREQRIERDRVETSQAKAAVRAFQAEREERVQRLKAGNDRSKALALQARQGCLEAGVGRVQGHLPAHTGQ